MGYYSFQHYDDPDRAQRVLDAYIPEGTCLIDPDVVFESIGTHDTADGLDLALEGIFFPPIVLKDGLTSRRDIKIKKGRDLNRPPRK